MEIKNFDPMVLQGNEKPCPFCHGDYVHPVALLIVCGNEWYKFTSEGFKSGHGQVRQGRGVVIERTYWCEECSAQWVEREQFHKGNTIVNTYKIEPEPTYVIWRD